MHSSALPAAQHLTASSARTFRTGHLLADCERWCRDQLPPRGAAPRPGVAVARAKSLGGPAASTRFETA